MKELWHHLELSTQTTNQIIWSVVVIFVVWLLRHAVNRLVHFGSDNARVNYQWRKGTSYVSYLVILLAVGRIWSPGMESLSTFLGLVTAGIAVALKDPIINAVGWLFIMWRGPLAVGDRIEIDGITGDVIDVRMFQFVMLELGNWVAADQSTGRVLYVPNGRVFSAPVFNYNQGFGYLWSEIPVLVTFESDWQKAKNILQQVGDTETEKLSKAAEQRARLAAKKSHILYNKLTPIVYTSIEDSGVMLTLRFLCEPRRRRGAEERVYEHILKNFAKHEDIDFAYPTRRIYDNRAEGKPGMNPFPADRA